MKNNEQWKEELKTRFFYKEKDNGYFMPISSPDLIGFLKTFIENLLTKRENEILDKVRNDPKYQIPMGVSQWLNHGEEYGYEKFWKKEILKQNRESIVEELRHWAEIQRYNAPNTIAQARQNIMIDLFVKKVQSLKEKLNENR